MPRTQDIVYRIFRGLFNAYLFAVVLSMYAYTRDATGDIKWLVLSWGALALGGGWLLAMGWFGIPFRRPRLLLEMLALFVALLLASALTSGSRGAALVEAGRFVSLFALYFTATQLYGTPEEARRPLRALCVAMGFATLYAAAQAAGYDTFPWGERTSDAYRHLPGPFGNPNYAAHALVLVIIVALYLLRSGWLWALPLLVGYASWLVYTEQRGGLLALAGAAGVLLLAAVIKRVMPRRPGRAAAVSLALAALLAALGAVGLMAVLKARTGSAFPLDTSILLRYQSFVGASRMAMEKPLLGFGPGIYKEANPRFWTPYEQEYFARDLRMNYHVHNDALELAADAGLPAAGVYLALMLLGAGMALVMAFSGGDRERRRLGWMLAALFSAFLVDGLFGFNLRLPVSASVLFLAFGLLDGVASASFAKPSEPARLSALWRCAAFAVTAGFAILGTCEFAGEYYLHKAMGAHAAGQKNEARYYLSWGGNMVPWNADFPWRAGQFLMKDGDLPGACRAFEESLALNPNQVMVHVTLAEAKLLIAQATPTDTPENTAKALSLFDESVRGARAALALCPSLAAADDTLGRASSLCATLLAAQEREDVRVRAKEYWETARDHLRRAVANNQVQENGPGLYRNLGRVCLALGEIGGAEDALARAAQTNLGDRDTWPLFLGFARDHKRFDRLRALLNEQIDWLRRRSEPDRKALATAHLFLANVLENGYGDLDGAENAYRSAVQGAPRLPEVWTNYARFAFEHGRVRSFEESIQLSCRALEENPSEKPLPRVASVDLVLRRGSAALENATLVLASAVRGADPTGPMPLAQAFGWSAVMLFEVLQQRPLTEPGACPSAFNLAIVFSNIGDFDRADKLFETAKGCLPGEMRAPLAVQWADMRVRQNRAGEALSMLSDAAAQTPEDFDVRWAMARTLVKLGRKTEARDAYNEVQAMPALDDKGRALIDEELKRLDNGPAQGVAAGG